MKITLDQNALAQAVTYHLKTIGISADILKVDFRYTRVPFAVFAEVELSEARVHASIKTPTTPIVEKEVISISMEPMVDPSNLPPEEPEPVEAPAPEKPSSPLFGG